MHCTSLQVLFFLFCLPRFNIKLWQFQFTPSVYMLLYFSYFQSGVDHWFRDLGSDVNRKRSSPSREESRKVVYFYFSNRQITCAICIFEYLKLTFNKLMWSKCINLHFFCCSGTFLGCFLLESKLRSCMNIRIASRTADHQCSLTVPVVSLLIALTSASG